MGIIIYLSEIHTFTSTRDPKVSIHGAKGSSKLSMHTDGSSGILARPTEHCARQGYLAYTVISSGFPKLPSATNGQNF